MSKDAFRLVVSEKRKSCWHCGFIVSEVAFGFRHSSLTLVLNGNRLYTVFIAV